MRTTGLIGGLSWHSTAGYYRMINEETQRRLGGHSSAEITMRSVDFSTIREHQLHGDWPAAGRMLATAARQCEAAGAEAVLICSNLMHAQGLRRRRGGGLRAWYNGHPDYADRTFDLSGERAPREPETATWR